MVSVLFWVSAGKYNWLIEKNNIGVFQFIYFFSSFWGQFGPNCTTFLLAGARRMTPFARVESSYREAACFSHPAARLAPLQSTSLAHGE